MGPRQIEAIDEHYMDRSKMQRILLAVRVGENRATKSGT